MLIIIIYINDRFVQRTLIEEQKPFFKWKDENILMVLTPPINEKIEKFYAINNMETSFIIYVYKIIYDYKKRT